jgi:hypothetical protein
MPLTVTVAELPDCDQRNAFSDSPMALHLTIGGQVARPVAAVGTVVKESQLKPFFGQSMYREFHPTHIPPPKKKKREKKILSRRTLTFDGDSDSSS